MTIDGLGMFIITAATLLVIFTVTYYERVNKELQEENRELIDALLANQQINHPTLRVIKGGTK
jgi:hypothetical protein